MIPVGWLDPSQDCWDTNMLRQLLDGALYPHGINFKHFAGFPNTDGPAVLVCPGRYWAQHTDRINESIQRFASVLFVVSSDEEALFDARRIEHPCMRFWIQTPREGSEYPQESRFFGVGCPPHFNQLPKEPPTKASSVFLAAQKTHHRRLEVFAALESIDVSVQAVATEGFTQGLSRGLYVRAMCEAKVAPAPSGAVSPDSFRLWEALEAHTIPIADAVSPVDGRTDYWGRLLAGCRLPIVIDYRDLCGYIEDSLAGWPATANRVAAWWMRMKRTYAIWLSEDLKELAAL